MILKEREGPSGHDERAKAGYQQEQDVAFFLRREYGDDPAVLIINDLHLEYEGERAQIDHLVVHPYGFVVIESKSVYGEVKVNAHGEWSRSYRGEWYGMPSPVRQAELQQALLKNLLRDNVEKFLGRILGIQMQVGGREWRTLCAVSSSAILYRDEMPRDINQRVVKSEFVGEKVRELIGSRVLGAVTGRPRFSQAEIDGIGDFLLKSHVGEAPAALSVSQRPAPVNAPVEAMKASAHLQPKRASDAAKARATANVGADLVQGNRLQEQSAAVQTSESGVSCKHCGENSKLNGKYGKFGYYVRCGACEKNTSMKMDCPSCQSRQTRIRKSGPVYTSTCQGCAHEWVVFRQPDQAGS